jgi:hypothetical protein
MADADARITQPSFTAGELSPELYGRKDLARYQVGLRKLLNGFVHAHGGASNRAGLKFAAEVKDHTKKNRLMTFEAANDEAFLLVWGDLNVRPMFQGAYIDNGGSPYEIATPYAHTDLALLYSEQSNDIATLTHPSFPVRELGRYDTLDWRMSTVTFASDVPTPTNVSAVVTQGYTGYNSDKLPVQYTYKVSMVDTDGQESLPSDEAITAGTVVLGYEQNFVTINWTSDAGGDFGSGVPTEGGGADVTTYFDRSFALVTGRTITHVGTWTSSPITGMVAKIATRTGAGNYTINVSQSFNHPGGGWHFVELAAPYVVPAGDNYVGIYSPNNFSRLTSSKLRSSKGGNQGLGAQTGFSEDTNKMPALRVTYQGVNDIEIDHYNVYKEKNGLFGLIGTTTDTTYKDDNFLPDFSNGPQDGRNPFEGDGNYPYLAAFVQQRRFFGGTVNDPQTIWGSQSANFANMGVSSPVRDDDAIEFTLASTKKQDIYHIVPLQKGMIVFTRSGEWSVTGRDGDVITPSSILPMPQTSYGSTRGLKPLIASREILFVPRTGRKVLATGYSLEADSYVATDLTIMAGHLFKGRKIVAWDIADDPDGVIWCVMDDGKGLSLTYLKEHDVFGWGRTETRGKLLDVSVVPESARDVPYFLVERRIGGSKKQYIEYMESRAFLDVRDAFFVDSGLSLNNPVTISAVAGGATVTLTSNAHGLVDGDLVELTGVNLYNDDEMLVHSLDGRWVVGNAAANTFRIKYEYDNTDLGVVAGDDVDLSAVTWTYYDPVGVFRKGFVSVTGLGHLNGRSVVGLVDGNAVDGMIVSGGTVTPDGEKHFRMHIGLSYQSVIGTLDVLNPQGDDTGMTKAQPACFVRIERTRGVKVGQTEATAVEQYSRSIEDYFDPATMFSGVYQVDLWETWENDLPLYFVQDYPLPMTILGVTKEIVYGGS